MEDLGAISGNLESFMRREDDVYPLRRHFNDMLERATNLEYYRTQKDGEKEYERLLAVFKEYYEKNKYLIEEKKDSST